MRVFHAIAIGIVFGVACSADDVSIEIALSSDAVSKAAWFEVGAYKDADCKTLGTLLANGLPEGANSRVAFARSAGVGPRFGDIATGSYAFAGVARDKQCTIVAQGCVAEDIGDTKSISIAMKSVKSGTGTCPEGNSCVAAKCVPANNNADPLVGAGCSLELLGAGPLLNTNDGGGGGGVISAPAVAPTSTGFVIAYRLAAPGGGSSRLILMPIDSAGGAYGVDKRVQNPPNVFALPSTNCSRGMETDGVGLLVGGETGLVTFANSCSEGASLAAINFTVSQDKGSTNLTAAFAPAFRQTGVSSATLSPVRNVAVRQNTSVLAYTQDGVGHLAAVDPTNGVSGNIGVNSFGGTAGITNAWVATTDKVLALLAAGTGAVSSTPADDAGSLGGDDTGEGDQPTLRLLVLDAGTAIDSINAATDSPRKPITFPGKFGSIAALGARVIVLTDVKGPGRSVTYRAYDLNNDSAADTSGFSVDGTGDVTAGDVAVQGDRAFFAVLKAGHPVQIGTSTTYEGGAIELHAFDHATTTLQPLSSVVFSRQPRISAINTIGDGRVAVVASPTRVAVAWTTQGVLDENDPPGGYAVFACTQ